MSLEEYLKGKGIWYRFVEKAETVHTSDASKATGIPLARITKNLVSVTDLGEYVLLVVPGDRRVDLKTAARALDVRNVSTLPFKDAEAVSGYPPGGTPTVGHKTRMRVVLDRSLLDHETLFCGGGSRNRILELRTQDVIRLTDALVAEIAEAPPILP